jgi:hypothetical protein
VKAHAFNIQKGSGKVLGSRQTDLRSSWRLAFSGDSDYIEPNFERFRKFVFALKRVSFATQKGP